MDVKKIFSVSALALAAAVAFAPFLAGADGGVNLPNLADPHGFTSLPAGIMLHASWTPLGYALMIIGLIAALVATISVWSSFTADRSLISASFDRGERAEMDYIDGRISGEALADVRSGVDGR